ncbi:MAG: hypothetical protein ACOCVZ_00495 [Gemmatimonadota bacterium]
MRRALIDRSPTVLLLLAGLVLLGPGSVHAQELTGVALGPDGRPLTDTPVALHRVDGGGGAFVATDTTTADGGFRFPLETQDSATYFAAVRFEGRMYIGPGVQAGAEPATGYILRVSPESEAGAVAGALSGAAPPPPPARAAPRTGQASSDTGAFLLVGLLALGAAAVFFVAAPRYRERRTLDGVIELARIENELAETDSAEQREWLQSARARLRKQLAPRS